MASKANVNTPSLNYLDMLPHWDLPHTLMGGTLAMRQAGIKYLPKEPKEQAKSYALRMSRTYLFPGYSKTVESLASKPFSKQLKFKGPAALDDMTDDMDLTGRNLTNFAHDLLKDAINDGISFIYVDHPIVDPEVVRTLDDYRKAGLRPYFIKLDASSVIEATATRTGGKDVLQRVRIRETTIEPDPENQWAQITVTRVRVLTPGAWALYEPDNHGKWNVASSGTTSIQVIPIIPVYTKRTDMFKALPPLEDLAQINCAHWQSCSDQQNILHVARVPLLFGKGFPDTAVIEIGANAMVTCKEVQSDLKYVEHGGKAIDSGNTDITNLEARMAILGYQPLVAKASYTRTATEVVADKSDTISDLQQWCRGLERAIEEAFALCAEYIGLGLTNTPIDVNCDVDFELLAREATNIDVLMKTRAARDLSRETFWEEMQRLGYLPESFDPVKEAALLVKEDADSLAGFTNSNPDPNPAAGAPGIPPNPEGTGETPKENPKQ